MDRPWYAVVQGVGRWTGIFLPFLLASATPSLAGAQSVELQFGRMGIAHEPPALDTRGDRFPTGFSLTGRYVSRWGPTLEVEVSRGTDTRTGSVCYGLIAEPAQCIVEPVEYSGGLLAVFFGWRFSAHIDRNWSLGVRPRFGIGRVRAEEVGQDTGQSARHDPSVVAFGASGEVRYQVPGSPVSVLASTGLGRIQPFALDRCADCYDVIRDSMSHWTLGLALGWALR